MRRFFDAKPLVVVLLALTVCSALTLAPSAAYANSAEPPAMTIIVPNGPDDLNLSIRFPDDSELEPVRLRKSSRAWESYFRFFYNDTRYSGPRSRDLFDGAVLVAVSGQKTFEVDFPVEAMRVYNGVLTLDFEVETLSVGTVPGREAKLVAMRVVTTLVIEGLIFFAFGYRKPVSWVVFLAVNLLTQGALNLSLSGVSVMWSGYWLFGLIFYEFFIFIIEMVAFGLILRKIEQSGVKAVACAFVANLLSLLVGGFMLSVLPI